MFTIPLVRVGNHWYPDLEHNRPEEIALDEKIERVINHFNSSKWYSPVIYLIEVTGIMPKTGVVEINDDDIEKYLNTDESFNLRLTVDGHEFVISSDLCKVLEDNFNLELCKTTYKIEIW